MITSPVVNLPKQAIFALEHPLTPAIFAVLRALKTINPGDTYYEAYLDKRKRFGEGFFDQYHLAWEAGRLAPPRVLEIGTRTGLSLCQLLAAYPSYEGVHAVTIDPFSDGFTSPALVQRNLKHLGIPLEIVEIIKGKSEEVIPKLFAERPDFFMDYCLVDGDHAKEAARRDLEMVAPRMAPGGTLVFDDISTAPGECALLDVWEAFKADHLHEFSFSEIMSGKGTGWGIRR